VAGAAVPSTSAGSTRGAERFGIGFRATAAATGMLQHLRRARVQRGRVRVAAGAGWESAGRGPYDRFRGDCCWPIRNLPARWWASEPGGCSTTTGSRPST
jgi:hypothetical protein